MQWLYAKRQQRIEYKKRKASRCPNPQKCSCVKDGQNEDEGANAEETHLGETELDRRAREVDRGLLDGVCENRGTAEVCLMCGSRVTTVNISGHAKHLR
jgi:hypothetical protein